MRQFIQIFIIGLLALSVVGCHGCKEPMADPCEGVEEVSADFTIMESGYPSTIGTPEIDTAFTPFDTDTVIRPYIVFSALEDAAEYTWIIGAETLYTRVVQRHGFPKGETIPITLIVKKEPNTLCFPDDDGIDTLTRYMYVLPDDYISRVYGQFHGYLEGSPEDTFTVSIEKREGNPGLFYHDIGNLTNTGCKNSPTSAFGFRQMAFFSQTIECDGPYGLARISDDNPDEITIRYSYEYDYAYDYKGQQFVFKGMRK